MRPAIGSVAFSPHTCATAWAFCLLFGCASQQAVPLLQADLPDRWETVTTIASAAPQPDLTNWWRVLGDPALDDLVARALQGNLNLAAAAERLRAARAMLIPAAGSLQPNLRFATTATPSPDSRSSYFQAGFDAQWELGLFGRAEAVGSIAAAEAGSAQVNWRAARATLVAEVVRTWLEWRDAERRQALLDEDVAMQRQRIQLLQTRVQARLAAGAEVTGARAALAQAEAARLEPGAAAQRSRQQLVVLLGDRNASLPESRHGGAASALGDVRIDETPADLLRTRPEIQRAEQLVLLAAGAVGEARANLYPRLALGGMLSTAWPLRSAATDSSVHSTLVFGPSVDIPLFDWGARRAVVDARDAELAAALLDYRQSVLEGVAEVQTALAALALQRERAAAALRARDALAELEIATATRLRLGLADQLDAGSARSARLQADLALSQAQLAHQLAFVALYKAFGGASPLSPTADTAVVQGAAP